MCSQTGYSEASRLMLQSTGIISMCPHVQLSVLFIWLFETCDFIWPCPELPVGAGAFTEFGHWQMAGHLGPWPGWKRWSGSTLFISTSERLGSLNARPYLPVVTKAVQLSRIFGVLRSKYYQLATISVNKFISYASPCCDKEIGEEAT